MFVIPAIVIVGPVINFDWGIIGQVIIIEVYASTPEIEIISVDHVLSDLDIATLRILKKVSKFPSFPTKNFLNFCFVDCSEYKK
jgi:hypothetical protein